MADDGNSIHITELEQRLAEKAEAEKAALEDSITDATPPIDPVPALTIPIFAKEWEPPTDRALYDLEVVALMNRDTGAYIEARCDPFDAEMVEEFVGGQLEMYLRQMTIAQTEAYRMGVAVNIYGAGLQMVQQLMMRNQQQDRQVREMIAREAGRTSKKKHRYGKGN